MTGKPVPEVSRRLAPDQARPAPATSWNDCDLVRCVEPTRDGGTVEKWRRVESGSFPLAHGVPGRVGLLRGYGNAIVPQVAATFVKAYIAARWDRVADGQ